MNFILTILYFTTYTIAYYKQGHALIGELVDILLDINTKQNINISIQEISPWADAIRKNSSFNWVKPLHFIDTDDNPENNECQVISFKEDKMNLFTALSNYSIRLQDKQNRNTEDLKFFVHFYQDLFQPLHMSGIYRGGNGYKLNFFGRKATLHQVWDSLILKRHIKEIGNKQKYLDNLVNLSKSYYPYRPTDFKFWIKHNNKLNCKCVYNNLSKNVSQNYLNNNKYIVESLIVISAINLKNILEHLFI